MSQDRDTRFRKGQSGNPSGRPRRPTPSGSAFDVAFKQTIHVKQNGVEREVTADEALQLRNVQDAMSPKPSSKAIRAVFRMIIKREAWRSKQIERNPPKPKVLLIRERDSDNAFEAMCLLGIAELNPDWLQQGAQVQELDGSAMPPDYNRILLEPWVVNEARARMPELLSDEDLSLRISQYTAKVEEASCNEAEHEHTDWSR